MLGREEREKAHSYILISGPFLPHTDKKYTGLDRFVGSTYLKLLISVSNTAGFSLQAVIPNQGDSCLLQRVCYPLEVAFRDKRYPHNERILQFVL